MNDPLFGFAVYAGVIAVFAIAATLFIGHRRRQIAAQLEAEREPGPAAELGKTR